MLFGWTASFGFTYHTTPTYDHGFANATTPAYQFRSTSVYSPSFDNKSTFVPLADDPYAGCASHKSIRKSNPWDENPDTGGGNAIGEVEDQLPVGEPLVLLLLALIYVGRLIVRKRCCKD